MTYAMQLSAHGGPENFQRIDLEVPEPGKGQVMM